MVSQETEAYRILIDRAERFSTARTNLEQACSEARVGSPALVALNDLANEYGARARKAIIETSSDKTALALGLAQQEERQIRREVNYHAVSLPGYNSSYDQLAKLARDIKNACREMDNATKQSALADTAQELFLLKDTILERQSQ